MTVPVDYRGLLDDDKPMPTPANAQAMVFTVRLDKTLVRDLDERRQKLGDLLGFPISRSEYLAHVCRQFWGDTQASDDPASRQAQRKR